MHYFVDMRDMFEKLDYFKLYLKYIVGGFVALAFGALVHEYAFAELSISDINLIRSEQEYAMKYTGEYFPDVSDKSVQIHTYETLCKGFVIRHETETEIQYLGYGDLADEYTRTETKEPILENLSVSSTTVINTQSTESLGSTTLGL